ncbi:DNA mismatch endonuclease Vsr [Agrobacterium genomosp. 3 str. RTP8]|uniref:very short patch repair endonuclease n=1 Tax=Agrobacterium tomkonis TaxID=1183410 RepID=UPI001CD96739|nr:DNA mismatch endonuclease Vsr [Agrobacterium tomkonis RTP8]
MTDVVDSVTRSRMMSGIRSKNTKPELVIRKGLHALGFRYRLHPKKILGKPDLWLPKYGAAIFIHGCFWHGHNCSLFKIPGTRQDFWKAKINTNRIRDARVNELLADAGLRRLEIWECAFRGPGRIGLEETLARTAEWLRGEEIGCEIRGTR